LEQIFCLDRIILAQECQDDFLLEMVVSAGVYVLIIEACAKDPDGSGNCPKDFGVCLLSLFRVVNISEVRDVSVKLDCAV
jgi:hypothetical protein